MGSQRAAQPRLVAAHHCGEPDAVVEAEFLHCSPKGVSINRFCRAGRRITPDFPRPRAPAPHAMIRPHA